MVSTPSSPASACSREGHVYPSPLTSAVPASGSPPRHRVHGTRPHQASPPRRNTATQRRVRARAAHRETLNPARTATRGRLRPGWFHGFPSGARRWEEGPSPYALRPPVSTAASPPISFAPLPKSVPRPVSAIHCILRSFPITVAWCGTDAANAHLRVFAMPPDPTSTDGGSEAAAGPSDGSMSSQSSPSESYAQSDANIRNFAPVARIMKGALPDNAKIAKEAKECMQECVSEFISFITSEGLLLPLYLCFQGALPFQTPRFPTVLRILR